MNNYDDLMEKFYQIDDLNIQIHMNSDNDFDYTIVDSNGNLIDGGILENTNNLSKIPSSAINEVVQMHNIDGEYLREISPEEWRKLEEVAYKFEDQSYYKEIGIDATYLASRDNLKALQVEEATQRMKYLRINENTIDDFKNGIVSVSYGLGAENHSLSIEQLVSVKNFEKEYDAVVYHVISDEYQMTDGSSMNMDSYLYVSSYPEEWSDDKEMLKNGIAYCYVENNNIPEFSEIGSIGFAPHNGGLVRQDYGYNFEPLSPTELADKIDEFFKNHDPYSYVDAEIYPGSNRDEAFSKVLHCDLNGVKDSLQNIINECAYMKFEAEELMSDISTYEKEFDNNVDMSDIDLSRGMSM